MKVIATPLWLNLILVITIFSCALHAQPTTLAPETDTTHSLYFELPIFDFPYHALASQMSANYSEHQAASIESEISVGNYLEAYLAPSMRLTIDASNAFHSAIHYGVVRGFETWLKPIDGRIYGRLLKELIAASLDGFLITIPFGIGWVHEEFHRNTMTVRNIGSYDEAWLFKQGGTVAVSHILDEDLIAFKKQYPAEHIRMSSAGIEGQYFQIKELQKRSFFQQTNLPNTGFYLLSTLTAVDYVGSGSDADYFAEIVEMLGYEETMEERDFTGHDFASWVYDLHRPDEPYENRGPHESGVGLNRYINPQDHTLEMTNYIEKMAKRQYLNYLSPTMLGIQNITINDQLKMNFAIRHYLTPFGDSRELDVLIKYEAYYLLIAPSVFTNKDNSYYGLEVEMVDGIAHLSDHAFRYTPRIVLWSQPENQRYADNKARAGGLFGLKVIHETDQRINYYLDVEAKSRGWVAGNPYLDSNLSLRLGACISLGASL